MSDPTFRGGAADFRGQRGDHRQDETVIISADEMAAARAQLAPGPAPTTAPGRAPAPVHSGTAATVGRSPSTAVLLILAALVVLALVAGFVVLALR